mgnify:CR=1 FL=1
MKKLARLFISVLLVTLALGTTKAIAAETVYVLKNTNLQYFENGSPEFMDACGLLAPLVVVSAPRSDLYSIQTQSAHGRVVNDHVKKVGELTSCIVWPTAPSDPVEFFPLYPGLGESIVDPNPSQNLNVLYFISLNGEQYFAGGSGRARTEGSWGIPYPGYFLIGATATVTKANSDSGFTFVGSFTNNVAVERIPGTGAPKKSGGIRVLRISEPGFLATPN